VEPITSLTNPRVKQLVRLRNRRERDATGTFLVEGFRELQRAVAGFVELVEVYHCPSLFLGTNEAGLLHRLEERGAALVELGEAAFRKAAYRDRPEGLIAVARQFDTSIDRLDLDGEPLVLVVESIEKPGNLGTMLRTADAAGVDAVIVCDPTTDPFNPNTVRASVGSLFTVPLAVTSTSTAIDHMGRRGVRTIATSPDAGDLYWTPGYAGAVGIVVGSEQYGLSKQWLEAATHRVRIPMHGSADSLNAAMAAGVVVFEAVRQRSAAPG
jgi:TrmH family RNA methyltransferase